MYLPHGNIRLYILYVIAGFCCTMYARVVLGKVPLRTLFLKYNITYVTSREVHAV